MRVDPGLLCRPTAGVRGQSSCAILQAMTPEKSMDRCKQFAMLDPLALGAVGRYGFRTAEQLILDAELTDDQRQRLLHQPVKRKFGCTSVAET